MNAVRKQKNYEDYGPSFEKSDAADGHLLPPPNESHLEDAGDSNLSDQAMSIRAGYAGPTASPNLVGRLVRLHRAWIHGGEDVAEQRARAVAIALFYGLPAIGIGAVIANLTLS